MNKEAKFFSATANSNPAINAVAVIPADVDLANYARGLYVGGAGNVVVQMAGEENTVTFSAVPAGTILPICVSQVRAATTATLIVALS
jgi:hypothetical protein